MKILYGLGFGQQVKYQNHENMDLNSDLDLVLNSDMVLDLASRTKTKTKKIWPCTQS